MNMKVLDRIAIWCILFITMFIAYYFVCYVNVWDAVINKQADLELVKTELYLRDHGYASVYDEE